MKEDNQFGQRGQYMKINYISHCYTGMSQAMLETVMQKSAHMYLHPWLREDASGLRMKQ